MDMFYMFQAILSNDLITHEDLISFIGKGDFLLISIQYDVRI